MDVIWEELPILQTHLKELGLPWQKNGLVRDLSNAAHSLVQLMAPSNPWSRYKALVFTGCHWSGA